MKIQNSNFQFPNKSKIQKLSFLRKQESYLTNMKIPAFAGMTIGYLNFDIDNQASEAIYRLR